MNKMTKEEIIEYFIDQLGDNKIFWIVSLTG